MTLSWSQNYSVDINTIDEQHKKFFSIFNKADELIAEPKSDVRSQKINEIFLGLDDYAKFHFAYEESYFEKFAYSRKDEHIAEHKKFIHDLEDLQSRFKSGEEDIVFNIISFLEGWLVSHISYSDKLYSECFRKNGVE